MSLKRLGRDYIFVLAISNIVSPDPDLSHQICHFLLSIYYVLPKEYFDWLLLYMNGGGGGNWLPLCVSGGIIVFKKVRLCILILYHT